MAPTAAAVAEAAGGVMLIFWGVRGSRGVE